MKVFLIRHTPTIAPKGVIYGRTDLDIKEPWEPLFREIMDYLSDDSSSHSELSGEQRHLYFSSPLIRCKKMAEFMSSTYLKPSASIHYDDRLMEIDFGDWEMGKWADIPREEIDHWMADFVNLAPPAGESFAEVYGRSVNFWKEQIESLLAEPLNVLPGEVSTARVKTVARMEPVVYIFGHGGVLRSFLCYIMGMDMKDAFKMILRHGSVTEIELNKDMRRTRLIHLSRGGVPYSF
jgi:alpha-ribazole phosphatase